MHCTLKTIRRIGTGLGCVLAAATLVAVTNPTLLAQSTQPGGDTGQSQPDMNLPAAGKIHTNAEKAMGGRKAMDKIESTHVKATMNNPMAGEMTLNARYGKDNKFSVIQQVMGRSITIGSNGEVGWTKDPMSGEYQVIRGERLEQMREGISLHDMAWNIKRDATEMKTVAREDFNDKDAYKVKFSNKAGEEWFGYYDTETNLPLGTSLTQQSQQGPVKLTIKFDDWKQKNDLKIFKKMTISQPMGGDMTVTLDTVEFNTVEPSVFEMPDAVKEKVGQNRDGGEDMGPTRNPDDMDDNSSHEGHDHDNGHGHDHDH